MPDAQFSFVHFSDVHVIDAASAKLVERTFRQIYGKRPPNRTLPSLK